MKNYLVLSVLVIVAGVLAGCGDAKSARETFVSACTNHGDPETRCNCAASWFDRTVGDDGLTHITEVMNSRIQGRFFSSHMFMIRSEYSRRMDRVSKGGRLLDFTYQELASVTMSALADCERL